jgi:methyltransferase (TIGR00027 family)
LLHSYLDDAAGVTNGHGKDSLEVTRAMVEGRRRLPRTAPGAAVALYLKGLSFVGSAIRLARQRSGYQRAAGDAGEGRLVAVMLNLVPTRSRFINAAMKKFAARHPNARRQLVILGAGFDTHGHSLSLPLQDDEDATFTTVIEMDTPTSVTAKRDILSAAAVPTVATVTQVPLDHTKETWASALERTPWRRDEPTFLLLEGILYYLPPPAVNSIFEDATSALFPKSTIVGDFALRRMYERDCWRTWAFRSALGMIGEPWLSWVGPSGGG